MAIRLALLHRDVERSIPTGLGDSKLQGNWFFVALKLAIPQDMLRTGQIHGADVLVEAYSP
jgi:hypothetical protein